MTTNRKTAYGLTDAGATGFTKRILPAVLAAFICMTGATTVVANTESEAATGVEQTGLSAVTRICVMANDTRTIELVRCEFCNTAYARYLERLSSLGFDCGLTPPPSLDRASAGFE